MDNLNIASILSELARTNLKNGDVAESKRLYFESFDMKKRLNLDGFNYWQALFYVTDDMLEVFEFDKAEKLFRDSFEEICLLSGENDDREDVAYIWFSHGLFKLASCAFEQSRLKYSSQISEEAREMARRLTGDSENGDFIAKTLCEQSKVVRAMGDAVFAERLYAESLTMKRIMYEENTDDVDIAESLLNLARTALSKQSYDDGEDFAQRSLEMLQLVRDGHPIIAEATHILATVKKKRVKL